MRRRAKTRMRGKELAFVRDVTAVQIAPGLTYREFSTRLRQVERTHLEEHRSTPRLRREIKRRVSELLLKEAIARGLAFETCRRRMNQLETLGFTDIETKSFHSLIYAKAARAHGHKVIAHRVATRMIDELRRSLRRRKSLLARSNWRALEKFLGKPA